MTHLVVDHLERAIVFLQHAEELHNIGILSRVSKGQLFP